MLEEGVKTLDHSSIFGYFVKYSPVSDEIGGGVELCHLSFLQHQDPT